jgi:predicted CoA-binding protein
MPAGCHEGGTRVTHENPSFETVAALLRRARTIAVVGLSDRPDRPSYRVARGMKRLGYRIIPVNPEIESWEGVDALPSLDAAVASLKPGEAIDIVDVFRRPEHVAAVVDDCLRLGLRALWLQLGVVDERAAARASAGGMTVVMDRCIYVDRTALE